MSEGQCLFSKSSQLWKENGFYFESKCKSSPTNEHLKSVCLGFAAEGNGTLLQYSCLANPMDGGTW